MIAVGCYAQLKPKEISEIEGVDLVLGAAEKFNLAAHLTDLTKTKKDIITRMGFEPNCHQAVMESFRYSNFIIKFICLLEYNLLFTLMATKVIISLNCTNVFKFIDVLGNTIIIRPFIKDV